MNPIIYEKLKKDVKMYDILKHNSYYIKQLNRNPKFYNTFIKDMKEKYKLRTTDKINEVIDNIDLISSVLDALK